MYEENEMCWKEKGVGIILPVLFVILSFFVCGCSSPSNNVQDIECVFYIKNNQLYVSNQEGNQTQKLTKELYLQSLIDRWDGNTSILEEYCIKYTNYFSENNRVIYPDRIEEIDFANDEHLYSLYYGDWVGTDDRIFEVNKIATVVKGDYIATQNGEKVFFVDDEDCLYVNDLSESIKIAENVKWFFWNEESGVLEYVVRSNDVWDLYTYNEEGETEEILKDFERVAYFGDEIRCYQKGYEIYSLVDGIELERIVSNPDGEFFSIQSADSEGNVYYLLSDKKIKISDLILDDCAEKDASIVEPDAKDRKYWKSWTTWDSWLTEEPITYVTEYTDEYYSLLKAYQEKVRRDELREEIEGVDITGIYSLYYYNGTENLKIMENVSVRTEFFNEDILLFSTYDVDSSEKILFSEVCDNIKEDNHYQVGDYIREQLALKMDYYIVADGHVSTVVENTYIDRVQMSQEGNVIYYIDNIDTSLCGDLYKAEVKESIVGEPKKINSNVYAYDATVPNEIVYYRDPVILYENTAIISGDLYVGTECVGSDVYGIVDNYYGVDINYTYDGTLFYLKYNEESNSVVIEQFDGNELKAISENMSRASYGMIPLGNNELYYIEWEKEKQNGTLMFLKDENSVVIDTGVRLVFDATVDCNN